MGTVTVKTLQDLKEKGEKFCCITAYDATFSRLISQAGRRWLEMEINDRGPGYPDAVLEKPFEPYVTFKTNGSGLGLAICRKIVSEHNGRISIHNPAVGGACTTVILPLG